MTEVVSSVERQALFTPSTLADYLAVSERQVYRWLKDGTIPSIKLGGVRRIDPSDVVAFLRSHRKEGAA